MILSALVFFLTADYYYQGQRIQFIQATILVRPEWTRRRSRVRSASTATVNISRAWARHPRPAAGKMTTNASNELNSPTSELDGAAMVQGRLMMTALI